MQVVARMRVQDAVDVTTGIVLRMHLGRSLPIPAWPSSYKNERIRVELESETGAFRRVRHKSANLEFLGEDTSGPPWRIEAVGEATWREAFGSFRWSQVDQQVTLDGETLDGIAVRNRLSLQGDEVAVCVAVTVPPTIALELDHRSSLKRVQFSITVEDGHSRIAYRYRRRKKCMPTKPDEAPKRLIDMAARANYARSQIVPHVHPHPLWLV